MFNFLELIHDEIPNAFYIGLHRQGMNPSGPWKWYTFNGNDMPVSWCQSYLCQKAYLLFRWPVSPIGHLMQIQMQHKIASSKNDSPEAPFKMKPLVGNPLLVNSSILVSQTAYARSKLAQLIISARLRSVLWKTAKTPRQCQQFSIRKTCQKALWKSININLWCFFCITKKFINKMS